MESSLCLFHWRNIKVCFSIVINITVICKPVAGVGDVEVEVPGLDVSERPPGRHVGGGHARASLTIGQ